LCADICDTATIYITIEEEVILNIPNGFSPNGDGINDAFYIEGLENYPNNDIIIFNRWGDEVFSAQPYDNNWEGRTTNNTLKISGDVVVDGTYYFVLNLNQVGENPKNGFIELRRN
jgi:gliding motility-associated-like protein